MEERFTAIESRLTKLEKKPKDRWDILQIFFSVMTPVSVAVVGWFITTSTKETENNYNQQIRL